MKNESNGIPAQVEVVAQAIMREAEKADRPIVVAIDGGSGSGKSTVAENLSSKLGAALIPLDDFFR